MQDKINAAHTKGVEQMIRVRRTDENLKCYFDKHRICIGTIDDFYGDYYANEYYRLPFTVDPIGKPSHILAVIEHEFNMARIAFDLKEEEEHTSWQEAQIRNNYPNIL